MVGVESYQVDFVAGHKRYYLAGVESYSDAMLLQLDPVAEQFCCQAIVAALGVAQADVVLYPEFVKRVTSADVIGYWAFPTGKKVVYFARKGEMHIEEIPKAMQ